MQEELEASLSKLELPPELDEFRRALLQSFQSVAQAAEQPAAAAAAAGAGGDGEEDGAMMEAFLKDVLSKDVLYEPFRDMRNMYPSWLAANRDKLPADEYARFEKQSALLVQICTAYETNASFDTIAVLMEQVKTKRVEKKKT
jgi:peroxin-19